MKAPIKFKQMTNFKPLSKASYIELFFDLVFIFCIRSILPLITTTDNYTVDGYACYTYAFTFMLMLQIWFNSTIFMNRLGRGDTRDTVFLITNMFLLVVMTQAISLSWENYIVYNNCWILISVNTIAHWLLRFKTIPDPSPAMIRDTRLAVASLAVQSMLVAIGNPLPSIPGQVVCFFALMSGFAFWIFASRDELTEANCEHLSERCALLMVLTFGETLIGFAEINVRELGYFFSIAYFLLIVGMFLVYLNQIQNALNLSTLKKSGKAYVVFSAWLTFIVANVTAGFTMTFEYVEVMGISGDFLFSANVALFLLSFIVFDRFTYIERQSRRHNLVRIIASLAVLLMSTPVLQAIVDIMAPLIASDDMWIDVLIALVYGSMAVSVLAVYVVLYLDWRALRKSKRKAEAAKELESEETPADLQEPAAPAEDADIPEDTEEKDKSCTA